MFSLEDARYIKNKLKEKKILEFKKSVDCIIGKEYIKYIYDDQIIRELHIKEMIENEWEYNEYSNKCREALYFSFYDEDNEIYVPFAEFTRRVESSVN